MDEQRALLDSLMGINRNHDRKSDEITDFRDERVCKFFLAGMCPHEMFTNTKMDFGACEKYHSEDLKEEFEKNGDPCMFDSLIERDFIGRINEIDRSIKRARARVEEEKGEESSNPDTNPDLIRIHTEIERCTTAAETAGDEGDIDKAQEMMALVEEYNKEKQAVLTRITEQRKALLQRTGVDVNKKLRVCDVCGSFLSILDSDKRLADHFMGKQHIGYQVMRDTVAEIQGRREQRRLKGDSCAAGGESEKGSGRERERSRDRDRDRDRDLRRERNDSRDRGDRRKYGGSGGGETRRERSRSPIRGRYDRDDRYRDKDGGRHRGDSRDRGRK